MTSNGNLWRRGISQTKTLLAEQCNPPALLFKLALPFLRCDESVLDGTPCSAEWRISSALITVIYLGCEVDIPNKWVPQLGWKGPAVQGVVNNNADEVVE